MKFTYTSGLRPLEGYTVKRGIGHGGFGEVYYGVSDGGKEVALKLVRSNLEIELRGVSKRFTARKRETLALTDIELAIRAHQRQGWKVFPVNPKGGEIEGLAVYARLTDIPEKIDRVSLYLPPAVGVKVLADVAAVKPEEFFVNPGDRCASFVKTTCLREIASPWRVRFPRGPRHCDRGRARRNPTGGERSASSRLRHSHGPTRAERSARIACFAQARISIIACSATERELTSPTVQSGICRLLSAAMFTES